MRFVSRVVGNRSNALTIRSARGGARGFHQSYSVLETFKVRLLEILNFQLPPLLDGVGVSLGFRVSALSARDGDEAN